MAKGRPVTQGCLEAVQVMLFTVILWAICTGVGDVICRLQGM